MSSNKPSLTSLPPELQLKIFRHLYAADPPLRLDPAKLVPPHGLIPAALATNFNMDLLAIPRLEPAEIPELKACATEAYFSVLTLCI